MDAKTLIASPRLCSVCGDPQPDGATHCPRDGNTLFTSPSLAIENTLPSALRDPVIGMRLGDYEVQHPIGEGGMGIVYRGLQPLIQKKVAIKVLRPEVSGDASLVKRFLAEAQAVNAIGHRNIIDIFTLGQLPDGRPYIVMEFLEGTPLDKYIKERSPLPADEVIELLLDICAPLQAAHTAGVIHRDLKPSNVFIVKQNDGTRYLKLLDFGLAKKSFDGHSAATSNMMVTGTPDYMSPEQARGADVSPRSDLYSLGVMAFELVTGQIPFRGVTPMDVLIKHVQMPPPKPSSLAKGCPPGLEQVILALLEKNPAQRLAPAEKLRAALKALQAGEELPELSAVTELTGRRSKRSPSPVLPVVLVMAALGVAAGLGTLALLRSPGASEPAMVAPPPPPRVTALTPPSPPPSPTVEDPPVPSPVEPAPVAPVKSPSRPPRPVAGALTPEALGARIERLDSRLRKSAGPGEEPDPAALVLLSRIKVSLATSRTAEERQAVQRSLDSWESTFLKR